MSNKMHIENIDASLDGIDEMVAHIRRLSDAGGKMADDLTNNMNSMSRSYTTLFRSHGLSFTPGRRAATRTLFST
jgi:hypothetical protein